jgi:hypothetical protein
VPFRVKWWFQPEQWHRLQPVCCSELARIETTQAEACATSSFGMRGM